MGKGSDMTIENALVFLIIIVAIVLVVGLVRR